MIRSPSGWGHGSVMPERTFSTAKDPASNNIAHGWTRLMGLTPITLWLACLLTVRNQRILTAWDARQAGDARRAAAGLPGRVNPNWPHSSPLMWLHIQWRRGRS